MKLLLKNAHLYHEHKFEDTDVLIEDGIITAIEREIATQVDELIDLQGKLLCHNFLDIHTHLREPGLEYKETIQTGTLSALYGGYGTIVAMANIKPCMDNKAMLDDLQGRFQEDACVNAYTYSAITKGLMGKELVNMEDNIQSPIVAGFSDDGRGVQSDEMMAVAMKEAKRLGSIIVAHCEDERELKGGCVHEGTYAKAHQLVGINSESEWKQVERDLKLVEKIHNRYHICHISTKETVALLKAAREKGLQASGEATPHHLILTDENIKDCHPNYKMNPPLRSREDHQALINGLNEGVITVISTDHAPHSREEKNQPIQKAPFGIIGLQHAFPLLYTHLVKKNLVSLETILDALTSGPAKTLGLKAQVAIGEKANLSAFDLNKEFEIKEEDLKSKANNTPFLGWHVFGKIRLNIVNGTLHEMEDENE